MSGNIKLVTVFPNIYSIGTPRPLQYLLCHNDMVIMVFQKFLYYEAPLSGSIPTQLFGGDVVAAIVW